MTPSSRRYNANKTPPSPADFRDVGRGGGGKNLSKPAGGPGGNRENPAADSPRRPKDHLTLPPPLPRREVRTKGRRFTLRGQSPGVYGARFGAIGPAGAPIGRRRFRNDSPWGTESRFGGQVPPCGGDLPLGGNGAPWRGGCRFYVVRRAGHWID